MVEAGEVLSPEFKEAGHRVYLFRPSDWPRFHNLCQKGLVRSAYAVESCVAEAVMKMAFGNGIGFQAAAAVHGPEMWYVPMPGWIVAEVDTDLPVPSPGRLPIPMTMPGAAM